DLERSSVGQSKQGREVSGSWSNFQKGDLVVFAARRNASRVGHIGIFIELDSSGRDFTFIHAAVKGGIQISHITEKYYSSRFLGTRRILPDFVSHKDEKVMEALPENTVIDVRDTLRLQEGDMRVLLMADGRWMVIGDDGSLNVPKDTASIVLSPSGTWSAIKHVSHRIPSRTDPPRQALVENDTPAPEAKYHTIKSGDTLSSIALRYKTSVSALSRLNGMSVKTTLRIGKRIRVK
ncbi:MAG: LysM peptidoglycan-binding domain-containing protein, partial [Anaerovoracaceae bacterium]